MLHFKSSLLEAAALAVALGPAACGSTQASPANSAENVRSAEPIISPYGETMDPVEPRSTATIERGPTNQPYIAPSAISNDSPKAANTTTLVSASGPIETWATDSQRDDVGVTNEMGMDVSGLNDGQIAAVVEVINQGEIQEAMLAQSKTMSPDVKRFAKDMASAHRDMETKTASLLARLQMSPTDNPVSNQLRTKAQNETATLQTMRGKDFDREYVDAQVRNHNKALDLFDKMMPHIKNPDFKTALINDRSKVEAHLRDAERVQETLQRGTTNTQPGGHGTMP